MKRLCLFSVMASMVLAPPVLAQKTAEAPAGKQESRKLAIPPRVVKPFLWKIEAGTAPNYLFGTIHVADARALKLHPLAEAAFKDAEAAYFEIDFREATDQMAAISLPAGEKLSDTLPEELIARLDVRLGKVMPGGANLRAAINARPVVWPLLIQQLQAQRRFQAQPLDMQLSTRALTSGKTVGGLEDPKAQLNELFKMTRNEQREFVRATLDAMDEADEKGEDQLMETIGYYLRGDGKAFHAYFMADLSAGDMPKAVTEKLIEGLLYARNKRIADKIQRIIAANPDRKHFFAVGTAHMLGEKSVLDYLKKAKITASRVGGGR